MLNFKTSISTLALIAGLSIGFAPQASFAQNAGAATAGQAIKEYVEKQADQLAKLDKAEKQKQENLNKQNAKPPTPAAAPPSGTGGMSGFVDPPAPKKPEEPGIVDKCIEGVCNFFKSLVGSEDEVKAQKAHNDAVHKLVEEKKKAAEALKNAESKTTAVPKTETTPTKAAEPKTVQPETPKTKTVESKPVLPEAPKTRTQSRLAPVVIPNKAAPALIPASRTAPTVVRTPAIAPNLNAARAPAIVPAIHPSTATTVVSTTVGPIRITTGSIVSTPRVPTPTIVTIRR